MVDRILTNNRVRISIWVVGVVFWAAACSDGSADVSSPNAAAADASQHSTDGSDQPEDTSRRDTTTDASDDDMPKDAGADTTPDATAVDTDGPDASSASCKRLDGPMYSGCIPNWNCPGDPQKNWKDRCESDSNGENGTFEGDLYDCPDDQQQGPITNYSVSPDPDKSSVGVVEDGSGNLSSYGGSTQFFDSGSGTINAGGNTDFWPGCGSDSNSYTTMASTSGLSRYPRVGDTFRFDIRITTDVVGGTKSNTYAGVMWGVQSGSGPLRGYRLTIDDGFRNEVDLQRIRGAGEPCTAQQPLANVHTQVDNNTWYRCTVSWKANGEMPWRCVNRDTGDLLAEQTHPIPDVDYKTGGVGFMITGSGDNSPKSAQFDNYEIIEHGGACAADH